MSTAHVLQVAAVVVAAFFIGAINPATLIARVLGHDLSTTGSGNPGATNAGRVLGPRWGVLVGVLDVLKGLLPTLAAGHWLGAHVAYAVGVAAVAGHIWSPYLRGRGGKGVATTLGAVLGVHPWFALAIVVVFAVTIVLVRRVSIGSIFGAFAMVGLAGLVTLGRAPGDLWTALWLLVLAGVVIWRHLNTIRAWWRQRRLT
ncbi:MAG: glycerol-3-phosphate acyltransferase [Humibacillus sp.]|nr:glycerol-3-phosphate acyltransferase [Humibacillus sp.]MDN5776422.1 glycerol-3-phosphate acyltransferase [Humibacillus sp.]